MTRAARLVLVWVLVSSATVAFAGALTGEAKRHFDRGFALYNLGHYSDAQTEFEAAYLIKQDASFLYNIAQCERGRARHAEAKSRFQAYLRTANPSAAQRAEVEKLMRDLDKAIAAPAAQPAPSDKPAAKPAEKPVEKRTLPPLPPPVDFASLPPDPPNKSAAWQAMMVGAMFRSCVGRDPSTIEAAEYSAHFAAGRSRFEVLAIIAKSAEARDAIRRAFVDLTGKEPSADAVEENVLALQRMQLSIAGLRERLDPRR